MIPYFHQFESRRPPTFSQMSQIRMTIWHFLAGLTVGASIWYLIWRWTDSLNPDAMIFSVVVASAETLFFVGTLIFFHDIWREGDTPQKPPPVSKIDVGLPADGLPIQVDVFITTFDEGQSIVRPTIADSKQLELPENVRLSIWLLDDGNRPDFKYLASEMGIGYFQRSDNVGFKAGNLKNAMLQTQGDFVVICDADTRVFPKMLINTLGYFRDSNVAWVQTPHWFYDIPEGQAWHNWMREKLPAWCTGNFCNLAAKWLQFLTGKENVGTDPLLSEPVLFFDVIQRRRNRNSASFCCGAGSIHRREALYETALGLLAKKRKRVRSQLGIELEPFKFHVSEDIYTSILMHSDPHRRWKSVYHSQVEARMLSPWTMDAWATQKLKYAGGTFDIMVRDNPLFRAGMPWRTKLHYLATFWSYLSVLWVPIMMFAPILSIMSGWAPVEAYSLVFFAHILPALILSELAMVVGCKGYNVNVGRIMAVGGLPITLRALWFVLRGQKPNFPTTPKIPIFSDDRFKRVTPNLLILLLMAATIVFGVYAHFAHWPGYSVSFLSVNVFWIFWNALGHIRVVAIACWRPRETHLKNEPAEPNVAFEQQGRTHRAT